LHVRADQTGCCDDPVFKDAGLSVGVIAVCLALAVCIPAIAQEPVVEDWRATRPETTGVMLDLDPSNNVFAVGETIDSVVTRKFAPDGNLLWERVTPRPPDRARASWISIPAPRPVGPPRGPSRCVSLLQCGAVALPQFAVEALKPRR
jgi:hypothetical protein